MTSTQHIGFDIAEDLEHRALAQQVEILWISGPTWHDVPAIAQKLGIAEAHVYSLLRSQS
jgi:hypothetical protein